MKKKKLAVLTGAGASAESGISTFRDSNGLWENYNVEDVASIDGWRRNPGLVLDFYNTRRKELASAKPNAAHLAIAELEKDYDVTVITQNVDNLHERAGSTGIIHLHGELTKVRPEDRCNDMDNFSEESVFDIGYGEIHLGDMAPDGAQLRPHIVWSRHTADRRHIPAGISCCRALQICRIRHTYIYNRSEGCPCP